MIDKVNITKKYGSALFINTANLRKNYCYLKNLVKPANVAPVLKSNAYGLGTTKVAKLLIEEGVQDIFVATSLEAITLREQVKSCNIFVLHGIFNEQEDVFIQYNLTPVLNTILQIEKWLKYAKKVNKRLDCVIHVDTGINRLGIFPHEVKLLFQKYPNINNYLNFVYIISHLACSSISTDKFNKLQLQTFNNTIAEFFPGCKSSLSASYGIFLGSEFYLDLIRPGFSLYGSNPTPKGENPLFPVIEFYSTILKINHINKAQGIGYNHVWKSSKPSTIATISVGYSDGVFLNHSKDAGLFIHNVKVPLVGRVSMDCLMVDITNLDFLVKEGDVVEIIGKNQDIDQFAALNNTINCQALNILSLRYPRFFY